MLASIVELLGGLFLSALPLLIGSCIVARLLRPYEPSAMEEKKSILKATKGRPFHRGGLLVSLV